MGTIFLAWSGDDDIDEWLRRVEDQAERDRYRAALVNVRRRGWSAGRDTDDYQLLEMERATEWSVTTLGAPVFDADGEVALGLFVLAFRDALTAEQVPDVAERLTKAAAAITESIHGRHPG
jgi:DNA-binding IclR family transcriptional regulator